MISDTRVDRKWGHVTVITRFTPQATVFDNALHTAIKQQGIDLSGNVQCLDMAGGCLTTLLEMRLVESTGYLYDCYAFAPVEPRFQTEQQQYRQAWLQALDANPPQLIIATSDECGPLSNRYAKLSRWPAFASLLQQHYTLADQWTPTQDQNFNGHKIHPYGFRIYLRHY